MIIRSRIKIADSWFYVFWFFLQVGKGFGLTSEDPLMNILTFCGIPFVIGKMLLTKWTKKDLVHCLLLYLLGIAVMFCSETTTFLLSIFCITAVKNLDIKRVLKINLTVRGLIFIVRTTIAMLGYADMQLIYRYDANGVPLARYALGYGHPNTAQFELLMITILVFWIYFERIKIYHYIMALAYNLFIFQYTNSRTSMVVCILFLLGALAISRKWGMIFCRIINACADKSWSIGMLFSILGCFAYIYIPAFRKLDTFSARFHTGSLTIRENSLPLFGIKEVTTDLGGIYLIYTGGLVLAILFMIGIWKLLRLKNIRQDTLLQWSFICLAVFTMMEHTVFSVLSNGLLLCLAYVIYPGMQPQRENRTAPRFCIRINSRRSEKWLKN